jgi:hypothetical protein
MTREKFDCLRVWPEWESSGIWAPIDPESLLVGPMVDYDELDLPPELVARFEAWQARFDAMTPGDDTSFPEPSWEVFHAEQQELAHALHAVVGGLVQWEIGGIAHTAGEDGPGVRLK